MARTHALALEARDALATVLGEDRRRDAGRHARVDDRDGDARGRSAGRAGGGRSVVAARRGSAPDRAVRPVRHRAADRRLAGAGGGIDRTDPAGPARVCRAVQRPGRHRATRRGTGRAEPLRSRPRSRLRSRLRRHPTRRRRSRRHHPTTTASCRSSREPTSCRRSSGRPSSRRGRRRRPPPPHPPEPPVPYQAGA